MEGTIKTINHGQYRIRSYWNITLINETAILESSCENIGLEVGGKTIRSD